MLRLEKNSENLTTKKIAVISVKWFYIIAEVNLGLHYEVENLDVYKVCFAKWLDVPSIKNQELKPWSTLNYRVWAEAVFQRCS